MVLVLGLATAPISHPYILEYSLDDSCVIYATVSTHAVLISAGAATDFTFLSLHSWLGPAAFLVFASVAAAGGVYVYRVLPETRGATLAEVQQLLKPTSAGAPASGLCFLRFNVRGTIRCGVGLAET